jgi:GTP-binding protein
LRHIERNPVLLFLVPADSMDIRKDFATLLGELEKFNPELLDKRRLLSISKSDLLDAELKEAIGEELSDLPHVFFSAVTGEGVQALKDQIWALIHGA